MQSKKKQKQRDPYAHDLWTNGAYRNKIQRDRKKEDKKRPPREDFEE